MEKSTKVAWVVSSAVIISFVGLAVKGLLGAVLGFILTLLVVGLFAIWKKYGNGD